MVHSLAESEDWHACCRNDQLPDVLRAAAELECNDTAFSKIVNEYSQRFMLDMDKEIHYFGGLLTRYGVEFVVALEDDVKRTEINPLRWPRWGDAARFGEEMVKIGKVKGFRVFSESAV